MFPEVTTSLPYKTPRRPNPARWNPEHQAGERVTPPPGSGLRTGHPGAGQTGPQRARGSSEGDPRLKWENKRKLKGKKKQQKGCDTLCERLQVSGIFAESRDEGWEARWAAAARGAAAQRAAAGGDHRKMQEICTGSSRCYERTVTQFPISERGVRTENLTRFPLKEENGEISELRGKWSALSRHPRWQGGGCQEDRKPTEVQGHTPYNAQDTKVPGKGCEILMLFIAAKVTNPGRKNSHEPSICIL